MRQPRRAFAERPSAANILLRQSLAKDGGDNKEPTHRATQLDVSVHQVKNDHCADIYDKENTVHSQSLPPTTANFSQQISEHVQPLHGSSLAIDRYNPLDPYSSEPVSSPVPQRTRPLSSCSPPFSPFSSISEQHEPPYLSDPNENDSLWNEVMASTKPVTQLNVTIQSPIESLDQPSMILALETPMFRWSVAEGRITELEYKLHWLNSLKPRDHSEKQRICNLAVSSLEQLRVPPIESDVEAGFWRLAQLADVRWRDSVFHYLFPFGSETSSLFAQLGDDDLHLIHLPSKPPGVEPPDRTYSMTAEIFPDQYRERLKTKFLTKKDYAAPYLTVFLTKQRDEDSCERMKLWGAHMLEARVTEWCRAYHPAKKTTKKLPPVARPTQSTTFRSLQQSTRKETKSAFKAPMASSSVYPSSKAQSEVGERVKGAPYHYCIALGHTQYSIWRFESDLRITPGGIERQGVICTQFKENSSLLTDLHWSSLASDVLGIHLDSANHAGILVKGAVASMGPLKAVAEALSESVAGESSETAVWRDQGREDAPMTEWASALEED